MEVLIFFNNMIILHIQLHIAIKLTHLLVVREVARQAIEVALVVEVEALVAVVDADN